MIRDGGKHARVSESLHVEREHRHALGSVGMLIPERREHRQARERLERTIQLADVDAMQTVALGRVELVRAHAFDGDLTTLPLHSRNGEESRLERERSGGMRPLERQQELMTPECGISH